MNGTALFVGRALHGPWNEGARMIARNLIHSAALFRPVRVLSLTNELFRSQPAGELPIGHVYTRLPYGALADYASLPRMLRRLDALLSQDVVTVAHLIGMPLALAPWLRRRGVAVVAHATLAGHAYLSRIERFRAACGWRAFEHWVDAYACSSDAVRAHLARMGCNPRKLHLVPPPVDIQRFRPASRAELRRAAGIPADAFVVLYVGSVSPLRFPLEHLLPALEAAGADIPGLRLEVVAPALTHSANRAWLAEHVRPAAARARIRVNIRHHDLDDAQKAALYAAADVVLLPFAAPVAVEPPLTLLEAMACEAAVLVSPHANRSQIVSHWDNGALFHSPAELTARLRQLHEFGPRRHSVLGAAARATVVGRYSIAAGAQALAALWGALGRVDARVGRDVWRELESSGARHASGLKPAASNTKPASAGWKSSEPIVAAGFQPASPDSEGFGPQRSSAPMTCGEGQ
jgi:glycosyltransferase involved in cell wall biosynthesis